MKKFFKKFSKKSYKGLAMDENEAWDMHDQPEVATKEVCTTPLRCFIACTHAIVRVFLLIRRYKYLQLSSPRRKKRVPRSLLRGCKRISGIQER